MVIAVLAAVVVLGLVVGWWGSPNPKPNPDAPVAQVSPDSEIPPKTNRSPFKLRHTNPDGTAMVRTTEVPALPPTAGNTNGIPDWEDKVDAILTSDGEDADKAKKLLEMFPRLSAEAQEEVAHHLSNLLPDEDYAAFGKYLTNDTLPEAVLDVLMEDVLNRPNNLKLPALLDVARDPQNPKAGEAKDVLELFLEEDYGTDWTKWQAAMDKWLKDNPD